MNCCYHPRKSSKGVGLNPYLAYMDSFSKPEFLIVRPHYRNHHEALKDFLY